MLPMKALILTCNLRLCIPNSWNTLFECSLTNGGMGTVESEDDIKTDMAPCNP